jgi:hypothetical protein
MLSLTLQQQQHHNNPNVQIKAEAQGPTVLKPFFTLDHFDLRRLWYHSKRILVC